MAQLKGQSGEGEKDGSDSTVKTPTPEAPPSTNLIAPPVWRKDDAPSPPGGGGSDTWPPQKVVAGRYRIVRFLGRGGMGDVYEAEDLDLQGHVALKTVRLDVAADPQLADRFRREIQIARKVTHPNICRIYDVGYDRPGPSEGSAAGAPEVRFLTMELLAGGTLSSRISRGRLGTAEALPIVEQMAAGLDAIHALGIVHRDFKSGNVMLVPSTGSRWPVRAVVTDFGLARPGSTTESLMSISESGRVVGTPAYMAPEQVEGKELTPAADVYALGIVMYEMVTGVRPFDGGSAITVAVRRLNETPAPPRKHVPELDPLWESTILRCLSRDPGARFQRASDVVKALGGAAVPASPPAAASGVTESLLTPSVARARARQRRWIAGVAALAAIVAALGSYLWRQRATPTPSVAGPRAAAPVAVRRAVAVLGFTNVSERPAAKWLSTAISEMLTTDIAAGGKVRAVSGEAVAQARRDLGLAEAESVGKDVLAKLRGALGADFLVSGSYTAIGDTQRPLLRIDIRLQNAASGEVVASGSATGTEEQLFDLVSRAGNPVREKLGLGRVSASEALAVEASLPSNREAARLYSEGLAKLRVADALGARDVLEKAVALDPKHPMPHAALAAAWTALGYEGRALEEAKKAAAAAGSLPPLEKLAIEARFHEASKDWDKAIESYRSLLGSSPDNLEFGLRLAEAQVSGGKAKEAVVTAESLRKLPRPVSDDPHIDFIHAMALSRLNQFKEQQALAARAAAKAAAQGSRILVTRARLLEAPALEALGQPQQALAAIEDARAISEAVGDQAGVGRALNQMGVTLYRRGDLEGAKKLFERSVAIHREIGDKRMTARSLLNHANALLGQGDLAAAEKLYAECVTTFQEIGAKQDIGVTLNDIGARLQNMGNLSGAEKKYQEALAIFGEIGRRRSVGMTLTNLAEVRFTRGDVKQAQDLHTEALAIRREVGDKSGAAYDLNRLGIVFAAKGDLNVARDRYQESLKLRKDLGQKVAAAETQLGLAALAAAEGKPKEAEALAREAEEVLRAERANDLDALALAILADALLAQKQTAEAQKVSDQARALAEKSKDRNVRFAVAILGARVRALSGKAEDVAAALQALEATRAEAAKLGFVGYQYEARLAAGQLELISGRSALGKARLQALAREADAKGFGLIGRKASNLLR